jgi:hypothetical protein
MTPAFSSSVPLCIGEWDNLVRLLSQQRPVTDAAAILGVKPATITGRTRRIRQWIVLLLPPVTVIARSPSPHPQDLKTIARKLSAMRVLTAQDVIFNFRFTLALPNRHELRRFSSPYTCSD